MSAQDVYDFENIIEAAVIAVFLAAGLTAVNSASPPEFQKARPRTEIQFVPGEAITPIRFTPVNNGLRVGAYRGRLGLMNITAADAPGKLAHATYRSTVRAVMDTDNFLTAVNGQIGGLVNHKIQFITPSGTTIEYQPEEGLEKSSLDYSVDFSIQATAWNNL